ncbi:MAG: acyltransferase [Bacteroidales bacterium]|nr:acyltransferase [Bacteroidales bacterium]
MFLYKLYCHIISFVKKFVFKLLYGKKLHLGKNFQFRKWFTLLLEGGEISIGDNVFFNNSCTICAKQKIIIGNGTIFGENVKIFDHNHKYTSTIFPIKKQGYTTAPIYIGNNCWIGSNVIILKGVTIGDNCVIGAGCVIFKDVPSNKLVLNKQDLLYQEINHLTT